MRMCAPGEPIRTGQSGRAEEVAEPLPQAAARRGRAMLPQLGNGPQRLASACAHNPGVAQQRICRRSPTRVLCEARLQEVNALG
eukprot:355821-Chlamydomonas_euryale.AAC.6